MVVSAAAAVGSAAEDGGDGSAGACAAGAAAAAGAQAQARTRRSSDSNGFMGLTARRGPRANYARVAAAVGQARTERVVGARRRRRSAVAAAMATLPNGDAADVP